MEHIRPDALFRPPDETVVERLSGPVFGWRIDPTAARLKHVHDAADHFWIINGALPRVSIGKCGSIFENCASVTRVDRDSSPLPFGNRESQHADHANTLMGPGPIMGRYPPRTAAANGCFRAHWNE